MSQLNLSARNYHRILKLARTIADLCAKELLRGVYMVYGRNGNNVFVFAEKPTVIQPNFFYS